MNKTINYQAFIEKKNILTIDNLLIDIIEYNHINDYIKGTINIKGNVFTDNLDNLTKLDETLSFNFECNEDVSNLSIVNFIYHLVEARGIEIEFDFNVELNEKRCINDSEIKTEIMDEINKKLDEEFMIEEQVENEILEDNTNDLPKTSRIVYRFSKDETGKRIVTRG